MGVEFGCCDPCGGVGTVSVGRGSSVGVGSSLSVGPIGTGRLLQCLSRVCGGVSRLSFPG